MLKKRLIPVLLLRNGLIVQSRGFSRYQNLGNPTAAVERLSSWASDELIYLDISPAPTFDPTRSDLKQPGLGDIRAVIREIAKTCLMPLTFGGGIRTIEDVEVRLGSGADKIAINTVALENPDFISQCARRYGSQCVVVSIDAKRVEAGWAVWKGGRTPTDRDPVSWARQAAASGAGEILINSMDQDGSKKGFDLDLLAAVSEAVTIPVIGMGGAGSWEHLEQALSTRISAVAVANLLHHSENSVYEAKCHLYERGCNVRRPLPLSTETKNL